MSKQKGIVSLDLETLSSYDDTVILSVGLAFHPKSKIKSVDDIVSTNIKLDAKDQIVNYHRHMDKETSDWWKKQSPAAKEVLIPKETDIKLIDLKSKIDEFLTKNNIDGFGSTWMDARVFDIPKIQYLYTRTFKEEWGGYLPFNKFDCMDYYTAFMILTGKRDCGIPDNTLDGIKHNSEYDARLDLYRYLTTLDEYGIFEGE